MELAKDARERSVEMTAHNVAACVHAALASRRMTVRELKEQISDWDAELVDSILLGVQSDQIKCSHMADLAFILGFQWDMTVRRLPDPEPKVAEAA